MPKLNFTEPEIELMRQHKNGAIKWGNDALFDLKRKIRNFKKIHKNNRCCYCMREFDSRSDLTVDIEHILPIGKVRKHAFTMKNLSVACKTCNMTVKCQDTSFLIGIQPTHKHPFRAKYYRFIHPNFQKLESHLTLNVSGNTDEGFSIKYTRKTQEAEPHYDYFKLYQLEIDTFTSTQGGKSNFNLHDIKSTM